MSDGAAAVKIGPGLIYVAPIGTAEPTSGSAALPSAWVAIGYTESGHTFTSETTVAPVEVAEVLPPILYSATTRATKLECQLAEINAQNFAVAFNGGTIGSPAGGQVTFEPPSLGQEQRLMLMWQSDDGQEALLLRKVLCSGAVAIARQKAPNKALIPVTFQCELPTNGDPEYQWWEPSALSHTDPH